MKSRLAMFAAAAALALSPLGAQALGKNEKGCLVGGAAGGIGGHLLGDHGLLGAAAGCAVGTYVANDRDKKQQAAKRRERERVAHSAPRARQREYRPASARGY